MNGLLNIFHYGDQQLELRVSGEGSERFLEFSMVLQQLEDDIKKHKPDVIVIGGDIYQYADTNGEEQEMFSKHLHAILPYTSRIVIIPGNHDIKQKNNSMIKNGEKTNISDSIKAIVTAINNTKISYYEKSGVYKDEVFPLSWAVWSQIYKHSSLEPKPAYSPWSHSDLPDGAFIELFHDPIRGAKDFSGEENIKFQKYGISLADFKSNLIIANDIHTPDIIHFGETSERIFTYSSSLIMRNFGEGDYYKDELKYVDGNNKHGYNRIVFNIDSNMPVSCEFFPIYNPFSRHTFYLSKTFNYNEFNIGKLYASINAKDNDPVLVRIVASGNLSEYTEQQKVFEELFYMKFPGGRLSLECTNDIVLEQSVDIEAIQDLESALDRNKIINLSKSYINKLVDATSTIDKDDKAEAKEYIIDLFVEEFNKQTFEQLLNKIDLVDFKVDNFMNFGQAEFDFKNNQINRIVGTNGIGKTKMWSFLAWLFTDSITAYQNAKEKTYNYSMFFNDSSDKDAVHGLGRFYVNGELCILEKSLTRSWKKNSKDIKHPEWWTLLKGAPVVDLKITIQQSNGTVVEKINDEASDYLKNVFGTFKDFESLTFADGISLRELVKRDSKILIQEILDAMGLTIIDNLLASYNSIKDEKLNSLKKPEYTAKEYNSMIEQQNQSKEELILKQSTFKSELKTFKSDITEKENQKKEKESLKHIVKTESELESEINQLQLEIDENTKSINEANATIDSSKEELGIDYDTKLEEQRKQSSTINTEINQLRLDITNSEKDIEVNKNKQKDLLTELSGKWHEDSKSTNETISTNEKNIHTLESAIQGVIQKFADDLQLMIDDLTNLLTSENQIYQQFQNAKTEIENQLKICSNNFENSSNLRRSHSNRLEKLLETEGKCSACGSSLVGEKLEKYQKQVEEERDAIKKIDLNIEALQNEMKTLEEQISSQKLEVDKQLLKVDEYKEKLQDIQDFRLKIAKEKILEINKYIEIQTYQEDIDKFKEAIETIKQSTEKLKDSISNEKLKEKLIEFTQTDPTYIELELDSKTKTEAKVGIEQSIDSKSEILKTIEQAIQTLTEAKSKQTKLKDSLQILKESIASKNATNIIKESRIKTINDVEISLARINKQIDNQIENLSTDIKLLNDGYLKASQDNQENQFSINKIDEKIDEYRTNIELYRKWKIADASMKLYKKLLSKDGLPQHIFSSIVPIINKMLNDHLSAVDFRLIFHPEYLDLRFIDVKRNTMRPVQFISGMQETIVGLSIILLKLSLNQSRKFNFMFIDEVSGKVTDGSSLTYQSKNYKKILSIFIQDLASKINIYIIDHVLRYSNERILEVQPDDLGSTIKEITTVMK